MRSLRQVDPGVHWTHAAALDALGHTLNRSRIEQVLKRCGVLEERTRKLTLVLAVLLCIAMNLFTEEAQDDVLVKLLQGPRFLRPEDDLEPASASAIAQRRPQVGVAPMAALFHEICRPLATPATRDAFLFGFRRMAIDGTTEDVADTPANARYFGRPTSGRCTCVRAARTRFATRGSGGMPSRNGWAGGASCARSGPACWCGGIVGFIAMPGVLAVGNRARTFWPGSGPTCR